MSKASIAEVVATAHDLLPIVSGIDIPRLLIAISGVESSYGTNAIPRHEDSWCPNQHGRNANKIVIPRHRRWGCEACCSWGPWQLLYHTAADQGFDGAPHELTDPHVSLAPVAQRLRAIAKQGAASVSDFADAWNSGTFRDGIVPVVYIARLVKEYATL